jgi:signal transduction histidine kinase
MTSRIDEVEAHQHGLRSPIAAIAGLAAAALQRRDLDDDLLTQLQAIRNLADDALRALEQDGPV